MTDWLVPPPREPLAGDEVFTGVDARVADFWRFALGDLRMNNVRGYLAEFLVGKALEIEPLRRVEWDAFDLIWQDITIEVKSAAYLQAWDQRRTSRIGFSGLRGVRWDAHGGEDPGGPRMNAMVYVFCVQTATDHDLFDPLNLEQWDFYVVPRSVLDTGGRKSIQLSVVKKLSGGAVPWRRLKQVVSDAGDHEDRPEDHTIWWEEEA